MSKFVEHLVGIGFHQVNVGNEEGKVLVKLDHVQRIDDRHEGPPVCIKKLEGFHIKFAADQILHEGRLFDGVLPMIRNFFLKIIEVGADFFFRHFKNGHVF